MSIADLERYRPEVAVPGDFDAQWAATLGEARSHELALRLERQPSPMTAFNVDDVTFAGFGGDPVKAWLVRPRHADGPTPLVVEYNGYGGGRGFPHERILWPSAGYAYMFMDSRGQGSSWGSGGHTADASGGGDAGGPSIPGFMTRGVLDFASYYFRRLITDAVRALDVAVSLPGIDRERIAVAGASQGGGLAIAAAGLSAVPTAALVDVPFLCHIARGVAIAEQDPYQEVARFLSVHRDSTGRVMETLSYVDGVNFAARATAPSLFSAALRDDVCPPSTVFAALNAWKGDSRINVYDFNGHEGGQAFQEVRQAVFLEQLWGR
jgi:cephalosporin-C deacetylase